MSVVPNRPYSKENFHIFKKGLAKNTFTICNAKRPIRLTQQMSEKFFKRATLTGVLFKGTFYSICLEVKKKTYLCDMIKRKLCCPKSFNHENKAFRFAETSYRSGRYREACQGQGAQAHCLCFSLPRLGRKHLTRYNYICSRSLTETAFFIIFTP